MTLRALSGKLYNHLISVFLIELHLEATRIESLQQLLHLFDSRLSSFQTLIENYFVSGLRLWVRVHIDPGLLREDHVTGLQINAQVLVLLKEFTSELSHLVSYSVIHLLKALLKHVF